MSPDCLIHKRQAQKRMRCAIGIALSVCIGSLLWACSGLSSAEGDTNGPAFERGTPALSGFNWDAARGDGATFLDTSSLASGFVGAVASSDQRLKFVVEKEGASYNYDMISGEPIICPLNMGDGTYTFSVMQNTSGNLYVTLYQETQDVLMLSEFEPFIRPNTFISYGADSACVAFANELTAQAENQGDVVRDIYNWVVDNIDYDVEKATNVSSGYVPHPDETLQSGKGICFDYASLTAAMLRSQGIPCKVITGYVLSGSIYHAWNMVYIDGSWQAIGFTVDSGTWTRLDATFAATGGNEYVGDGHDYIDRYTY